MTVPYLQIDNLTKSFGDLVLFENISFGIAEGQRVGLIAKNGSGKTTLLNIIAGKEGYDSGSIVFRRDLRVDYLEQDPQYPEELTVLEACFHHGNSTVELIKEYERCMETEGHPGLEDLLARMDQEKAWEYEQKAKQILSQLKIRNFDQKVKQLSGGQLKRVALANALITEPDLLILDEPTNHLDLDMTEWLEEYLRRTNLSLLMVTHDRYFLDKVTNRILEISRGKLYGYEANYSKFLEMKAEREEMELASERKRQSVLRMELEWAKRGCRARTTKQKARLERLELLKNGKAPETDRLAEIDSVETRMGKKTIELHHVSKSYGERKLIDDFDYIVLKNQNLGIVGPNGCGKSTLLKMIAGLVEPDEGTIEIGETIRIGYFAQELPEMNTSQRVIDFVKDIAEYIPTKDGRITASQMLERFLFTPDMQYAPIEKLSGGEKKRLYLLSVLQAAPNVLIFDEANNDIDIPTMTILEDYLNSFQGIVITVSHDRYFLDNVVDRIFEFDGNGHLQQYEGGYTDYIEAKQKREVPKEEVKAKKSTGKNDWKQNRPTKLKFSYMEQKEFETIDEDIAKLEEKLEKLDADMMANATNSAKLSELTLEKEFAEKQLEEKMERWVYLNDLAERIAAQ